MSWMVALVQMQLLKDSVPILNVCTIPLWIIILHPSLMRVSLITQFMILIRRMFLFMISKPPVDVKTW